MAGCSRRHPDSTGTWSPLRLVCFYEDSHRSGWSVPIHGNPDSVDLFRRTGDLCPGHGSCRTLAGQNRAAADDYSRRAVTGPGFRARRFFRQHILDAIPVSRCRGRRWNRHGLRRSNRRGCEVVPGQEGNDHRTGRGRFRLWRHHLGQTGRKLVWRLAEHHQPLWTPRCAKRFR